MEWLGIPLIRFIYYIYNYRLLYYLPMERMAKIVYVRDANWNLVQTTIKDLREDRLEQLEEENKKLKAELGEYKKMFENQLKEGYIKNTAEFLDKKFPKVNWFMEEDTLQELRDIGET